MLKKLLPVLFAALLAITLLSGCATVIPTGSVDPGEPSNSPQESDAPESDQEAPALEAGKTAGGKYSNAYFGFECALDDAWHIADEAEMKQLGLSVAGQSDLVADALESGKTVFDLYATKDGGVISLNVVLSDLGAAYSLLPGDTVTVGESEIEQEKTSLANLGFTNLLGEIDTAEFAGKTCTLICFTADLPTESATFPYYQRQIMFRRGRYLATVTAASLSQDSTSDILNLFKAS